MLEKTYSAIKSGMGRADSRIFSGTMRAIVFILLAKMAGAAKEVVVAAIYGRSVDVDAYLLVFRLYDLPVTVWTGMLAATFLPLFFRAADRADDFITFRRELLGLALLGGGCVALAAALGVPAILHFQSFGLTDAARQLAAGMAAPMALTVPLGLVSGIAFTRLMAAERQIGSLMEGVPALILLATLLVFPFGGGGPLAWGTVAGYAAAAVALLLVRIPGDRPHLPLFSFRASFWPGFIRSSAVVALAGFVMSVTGVIDQLMVAHVGPAAIATLGYATRILALAVGVGAAAVTRGILPVLAEAEQRGSGEAFRIASRWSAFFLLLGTIGAIVGWLLAPFAVRIIFERGAFTPADTAAVSEVLRFGLLQLPFNFAGVIMAQLWAVRRRYRVFIAVNGAALAVKVGANALLIPSFGIDGAMIATALMYAACLAILWIFALGRPRQPASSPVHAGAPAGTS
jgi:peptidoglycan biosynthesis protein MviN/MurJ (putative lipid II flippase)